MKKIILISAIAVTGLFADMATDMVKDAVVSEAKSEARSTAVKHIAGDDAMKKELVNKGADKVMGKENPVDKMKADALGGVMGSKTSVPDAGSLVKGATKKETSLEDKALDMAAEKAVGSNPLKKAAAKEAVKSAL
ncbi:MAG: hypothetical protein B6D54_03640 [Epsilonproteobacteria bacterium 4484_65]|nr:MAG: hypothetical protein B6D54_03640 [Epsilonproteobacteria bacterium 4484_65]